ncbi:MAG: hypothetical protein WKF79_09400 [Nocardioides sp.]
MGRVRRSVAVSAIVVLTLSGCASGSPAIPTGGVDGLIVPTPSPDPADFVEVVDNPWLPLEPGAVRTYASDDEPESRLRVTVEEGPVIAGVATTAARSVSSPPDDGEIADQVDYFAQDVAGNVWWFGREGEWQAGEGGAQAGVVMVARPRVGDGYREASAEGDAVQVSEIVAVDEDVELPASTYGDVLVIETTWPSGDVVLNHYVRGTGLILRETEGGLALGLVR